jgi:ArsR family transcriptional regulator, arsenate/arsenite/antimonite-responsive transcriptional repressor
MRSEPVTWRKKATRKGRGSARGDEELSALAWGLAHPARVAILRLLLARGECICGAIVDSMPLAQATVSQHLKVLKESGWIRGEIDGPRICYCPTAGAAERFQRLLMDLAPERERES